jgi:hypothetical protein
MQAWPSMRLMVCGLVPVHEEEPIMSTPLFEGEGGAIVLPAPVLCDRLDGGHLVVNPPRAVWERSELTTSELVSWSLLVAATGAAMLQVLPVLRDGCVNYWEAGNWALNDRAPPVGPKHVQTHRRVHQHVFGRSRRSRDPDWRWGESPRFPALAELGEWSARRERLTQEECAEVVCVVRRLLRTRFRMPQGLPAQAHACEEHQ